MYNLDPEFDRVTDLREDLESFGLIPKKNKTNKQSWFLNEDFSSLAKLRNPFEDHSPEEEEGSEHMDHGDEEAPESDEHADADHDAMGDHAEPDGDEDAAGNEPQADPGSEEEMPSEEAHEEEPVPAKKPVAPMNSMAGMGESKLIRKSKALMEQAKGLVNKLNESDKTDAFKGFALIAMISEAVARGFLKLSKRLDESDLRGVAKAFKILAENAGNTAFAIHESKNPNNLDESFKNQMSMLLSGLRLFEDITEMCNHSEGAHEGDSDEHDAKHGDHVHGDGVHIDVTRGQHNPDESTDSDSDDDKDVEEENLY